MRVEAKNYTSNEGAPEVILIHLFPDTPEEAEFLRMSNAQLNFFKAGVAGGQEATIRLAQTKNPEV